MWTSTVARAGCPRGGLRERGGRVREHRFGCTVVGCLSATVAENIVRHRDANGPFKRRKDLLKVARLGEDL